MAERDPLDRLLDAALSTYADPGPDSGLEAGILARIGAERTAGHRHHWRLLWAAGMPALAACLLLLLAPALWRHAAPHTAPRIQPSAEHPLIASSARPALAKPVRRSVRHVVRTPDSSIPRPTATPKLDVFPAPEPLSPQEQALVRFVAMTSVAQRKDLMQAQQQAVAPLRITAISIPPIEPPAEGKE